MSIKAKKEACLVFITTGVWRIRARLKLNGKIVQKQRTITGTKEEAKSVLQQLKTEMREGKSCSLTLLKTFKDVLDIYCQKRDISNKSYKSRINKLAVDLGDIPINCFADRFEEYIRIMRISPITKTGKPPSNAQINVLVAITKAAFNLCVNLGLLEKNPVNRVRFPKLKEIPRDVTLTDLEKQRLFNVIDREAPHLSAIVGFAMQVPCRISELVNMKTSDLDLFNNCIRVHNGTTKNDIGSWKPLPPNMIDYFRTIPSTSEYLFYRKQGNEYRGLGNFCKSWNKCLRLAGIEGYRFHDTRHEAATALIDNGTPSQVVMQVAGWKTDMLRTYYHKDGKKALELVRFSGKNETTMKTPSIENI